MDTPSRRQLVWRVAWPFLLFVAIGSLAIVLVLQSVYGHQSRQDFVALAEANAEFLKTVRLPATERFTAYLNRVLNLTTYFRLPTGELIPPAGELTDALHNLPPDHGISGLGNGREAVAVPAGDAALLILVREVPDARTLLVRPATLGVLAVFWGLSVALAWAVAWWIIRPYLQTLDELARSERLALLGKMATALAHEIHNPVAAIRLHAELANDPIIVHEAATIESLVNQWMFLARPEPPQRSPVALADLLAQTVAALQPQARHARVQIELRAAPSQTVEADARRLGQVFQNVVLNAIQAMPAGGTLTITARDRVVEFTDTGAGFSPTALARHAEMFYSEKEGGMGIGLSVATEIIKAHGGRLTVANQPTGGASVRIEL